MSGAVVTVADRAHAYVQEPGGWCVNNAGIVVGADSVLVVDTAATERRTLRLRAAVDGLAPGLRRIVVSTHHHGDHTFGNHLLAGPGSLLVAHARGPAELLRKGLSLQSMWPGVEWGRTETVLPSLTVHDRIGLDLGGVTAEVFHPGVAHTADDLVVWLPEQRVLYAGDLVFSAAAPFVLMGSVSGSRAALARLRELRPRVVVPGHGPVGGPELLDVTEAYLARVADLAEDGVARGLGPLDTALRAGPGPFAGLADGERLVGNLHRAFHEVRGGAPGERIASAEAMREMVRYNGGRPLSCAA
ncbi:MBL fold metallo-hydrolase [uncultured Streptomyces sp.]|uniref:MBL fold metallo-hydrolase n=1 Tax=uncultured Streptomyces sp. TaxID=174707 RepID=UPI002620223F|nr:MBL fold metallo-hydrolase [uncultured Streptomyces sp.]